jgi:hypothetical protein
MTLQPLALTTHLREGRCPTAVECHAVLVLEVEGCWVGGASLSSFSES